MTSRNDPKFLTKIFNSFAKKAVEDFPQLKNRFVLYSVPTDTVHGSPGTKEDAEGGAMYLQTIISRAGPSIGTAFATRATEYYLIGFVKEPTYRSITSSADPYEQEIFGMLEHELGHLIAPGGSSFKNEYSRNFCESVADTFSFIRQQQAYKDIQRPLGARNWNRAFLLVRNGVEFPLTLRVLTALEGLSQTHDLSSLTPVQSANLAYRLTLQYALPQDQLDQLTDIFAPAQRIRALEPALKKCAEIMLADHGEQSQMAFMIGKTVLEPFLNNRLEILSSAMPMEAAMKMKLEGEFWDDIRARIKTRDSQTKETPEQIRAHEINYLQALGHFDQQTVKIIDPAQYESKENQAHLKQAKKAYVAKHFGQ